MFRQSAPPNQGLPFWQTGYGSWELCSLRCRKLPSIDGTSITGLRRAAGIGARGGMSVQLNMPPWPGSSGSGGSSGLWFGSSGFGQLATVTFVEESELGRASSSSSSSCSSALDRSSRAEVGATIT